MRQNRNDNEIKASQESDEKRKKTIHETCDDNEIKADREHEQKWKKAKCRDSKFKIQNAFKAVEDMSMVDPVILNTETWNNTKRFYKCYFWRTHIYLWHMHWILFQKQCYESKS